MSGTAGREPVRPRWVYVRINEIETVSVPSLNNPPNHVYYARVLLQCHGTGVTMLHVKSVRIPNRVNTGLGGVASRLKHSSRRLGLQTDARRTRKVSAVSESFTDRKFLAAKPNHATREAMAELEQGRGVRFDSVEELIQDLGI